VTLPARKGEVHEPIPVPYMALEHAAPLLGLDAGHLRRLCRDQYSPAGLAKKIGGRWVVHPNADPRLRGIETWSTRDIRQIAELKSEGVSAEYIRLAETKRRIILGFADFEGHGRDDENRRRQYINSLLAKKVISCSGIKKLTPRTIRSWTDLYRQQGEGGGIRALVRRHGARGEATIGRVAWSMFLHVRHTGTGLSVAAAYDQVLGYIREQGRAEDPELSWPSLRTVQLHYNAYTPEPVRVLVDEGPHVFRAKCLPKVARSYADVAAGECFCGDERTLDFMCRVAGDRGWRRIRPKLTAWLDVRSRMFISWYIGERANSDTILSSFKAGCLLIETAPVEVIVDNGVDYKAVGGRSRRNRKWDEFDSNRVETAFERMEIEAHYAIVRHPWSKMIESHFNAVKDGFDRFMPSFWGGKPEERPWDAEKWTKTNLLELKTLDEVREAFADFLAAHHEKPQRGDSMDGLSPRQALRQFYTTERRAVNEDMLELMCCRMHGPVKVTRDGVRYQRLQYGKFDETVWRMMGQSVWLAVDPVQADYVTLCKEDGSAICRAQLDRNRGVPRDEIREVIAFQRRCEKEVKKYAPARDYLLKTRPAQIANRQKLAAQARQIPDDQLPEPPKPESVRLVRPDLAASAERVKRAAGAEAMRRLTGTNQAAEGINAQRRFVDFAQFANASEDAEEAPSPSRRVVDFAQFATEEEPDES
jgi:hypothetical protein